MTQQRMNEIVKTIHKSGEATLVLAGRTIVVGFSGAGKEGTLTMLGGGYYTVKATDGKRYEIAKGELVETA